MSIVIKQGDITQINCDAIINPANSYGYMGGGVAGFIKRVGGKEIEKEAVNKAPIMIGKAIVTTASNLPCKYVIHAPTMKKPAIRTSLINIERATYAALKLAEELGLRCIAIPGMGTGVGKISPLKAAKVIIKIVKDFEDSFDKIILIDLNKEMIDSFKSNF
jgi:O-acetyl-ADP-ribose deacetylase (regulator of RNase III)